MVIKGDTVELSAVLHAYPECQCNHVRVNLHIVSRTREIVDAICCLVLSTLITWQYTLNEALQTGATKRLCDRVYRQVPP